MTMHTSLNLFSAIDENARITLRENNYEQQIHQLNNSLEPLDFKIASILDEATGVKIWAFVCQFIQDKIFVLSFYFTD